MLLSGGFNVTVSAFEVVVPQPSISSGGGYFIDVTVIKPYTPSSSTATAKDNNDDDSRGGAKPIPYVVHLSGKPYFVR